MIEVIVVILYVTSVRIAEATAAYVKFKMLQHSSLLK